MAKKILAVSGGIDSMVMLDVIYRSGKYAPGDIIIAHFNHGTRQSSVMDAEFVEKKAQKYGLEFRGGYAELGADISEEIARKARYVFLRKVSELTGGAEIFTAHHLNDLAETVAINLLRGTGWRGLACLSAEGVRRPFLEPELLVTNDSVWDKRRIYEYAAQNKVAFREDPTNSSDEYLRNRIRHQMNNVDLEQVYTLWCRQKQLRTEIDAIINAMIPPLGGAWERGWLRRIEPVLGLELLRAGTLRAGISATRPQLERLRQAILEYKPGKLFNLPGGRMVKIEKDRFRL